jgi:hypothetical protein
MRTIELSEIVLYLIFMDKEKRWSETVDYSTDMMLRSIESKMEYNAVVQIGTKGICSYFWTVVVAIGIWDSLFALFLLLTSFYKKVKYKPRVSGLYRCYGLDVRTNSDPLFCSMQVRRVEELVPYCDGTHKVMFDDTKNGADEHN